jgi:type IV pilus assembly protein PilW
MKQRKPLHNSLPRRPQEHGFGIVELMVAIALGLFLVGGAISVFVTNQQAYRTTEQLSRMQESGRTAVELMARQLREAGGSPCGRNILTGNTINNSGTYWWSNWEDGMEGFNDNEVAGAVAFGTAEGERIDGTDAVFLVFGDANNNAVIENHTPPVNAVFQVASADHGLIEGDIVLVCNYRQAAIIQITNVNAANRTVVHNTGTGTPGNCSVGLGFPTDCTSVIGNLYEFGNGFLVRLAAETWYVGANGRGGRSLYRARLVNNAGVPSTRNEEIAEGVTDLQITYLQLDAAGALPADYVDASAVTEWSDVTAMRVTLTLQSLQNVGTDGAPLERQMTYVVSLRNRLP